jgi:ATP-dependent DNA helicase RecG
LPYSALIPVIAIISDNLKSTTGGSAFLHQILVLRGGKANLNFVRLILEENQTGSLLSTDELIILNQIWFEGSVTAKITSEVIQKPLVDARIRLNLLIGRGLIESKGSKIDKSYNFTASIFGKFKKGSSYVQQRGFESIQHEQMIMQYLDKYGKITRRDVMKLCRIGGMQAFRLLKRLSDSSKLTRYGKNKGTWHE